MRYGTPRSAFLTSDSVRKPFLLIPKYTKPPMKALPLLFALSALPAMAATVNLTASNDTYLRDGRSYTTNGTTDNLDFRFDFTAYFQFDLSGLGSSITINSATLTLHKLANARNDTMVTGRVEMYGLNDAAGNTEQNWDETDGGWSAVVSEDHGLDFRNAGADWVAGTGAVAANLTNLDAELSANVTENVSGGTVYTLTGPDLVSFIQGRANDDGFVTLIAENPLADGRGFGLATKENADSGLHPTLSLDYTVVPEPSIALLGGLGLFGLLGRRRG